MTDNQQKTVTIVLPCLNEEQPLGELLPRITATVPHAEVIVVDDGSIDQSSEVAARHGARVVRHPYRMGNGAAIKAGARAATGSVIVFMDADGQHNPADIPRLLAKLDEGYAMAVGARHARSHASLGRKVANLFFNRLASLMTGFPINDLTSGFRAVHAKQFRRFLYLLPNGFSCPTTSTMAFFRSGYPVAYVPIEVRQRRGSSNISPLRDGIRFSVIILKVGALFSPMRLFLPISAALFAGGISYYLYTYIQSDRFTNMGLLLIISALFTFLIGLLSEQVSSLHYRDAEPRNRDVP